MLLGYKESPVAEARARFGGLVRALVREGLAGRGAAMTEIAGGPIDVVTVVPSTRRPGPAPLARVDGLADAVRSLVPSASWAPALLGRAPQAGPPPVAHMRPDAAAFVVPPRCRGLVRGTRVLLLDDTYVSGARSQSAAAALRLEGAMPVVVPLGRVLRPDRIARHAAFLARHTAAPL